MSGVGTQGERIAALEADQSSHERICAERYAGIDAKIDRIFGLLWTIAGGVVALLIAMLGWSWIQLYTLQTARLPAAAPVAIAVSPPAPQQGTAP